MKITKALYDEFFSVDSIKRKAELRDLIHNAIESALKEQTEVYDWYFPDASEEAGYFEENLDDYGVLVEYRATTYGRPKWMTIPFVDFIE